MQSPPQLTIIGRVGKKINVYVGFRCFIVFNNKEFYGPFLPSMASPSDPTLPSCHAEVHAIKELLSMKRNLSKAKLYGVRWIFNDKTKDWELADGVPCKDCSNFIKKCGIKKIGISFGSENTIKHVNIDYILDKTKPCTGRLYGK